MLALPSRSTYACDMARADCPICQGSGWKVVERTTQGAQPLSADKPSGAAGEPKMVWAIPCDCTGAGAGVVYGQNAHAGMSLIESTLLGANGAISLAPSPLICACTSARRPAGLEERFHPNSSSSQLVA